MVYPRKTKAEIRADKAAARAAKKRDDGASFRRRPADPPACRINGRLRAAVYLRISEDEYDQVQAVNRQWKASTGVCDLLGFDVVVVYVDNDKSATTGIRPDFERMLVEATQDVFDVIVGERTDRVYRTLKDLGRLTDVLRAYNIPVHPAFSGRIDLTHADGRLQANIAGSVGQWESEVKSERIRSAAAQRASQGRQSGGGIRPFGYAQLDRKRKWIMQPGVELVDGVEVETRVSTPIDRPTGPLTVVLPEAAAIRWAYAKILGEGGSLAAVAREWNDVLGLATPSGYPWSHKDVRHVLMRPMNAGVLLHKGNRVAVPAKTPALVTEKQWQDMCILLNDPSRRTSVGRPPTTLLGGLLQCGVCLEPCTGMSRNNYGCRDGHVKRTRPWLDALLTDYAVAYVTAHASRLIKPTSPTSDVVVAAIEEANNLRLKLETLPKAFAANPKAQAEDLVAALTSTRDRLDVVTGLISRRSARPALSDMASAASPAEHWAAKNKAVQRQLLRELLAQVVMYPATGRHDTSTIVPMVRDEHTA